MALDLKRSKAVVELGEALSDLLPGTPHPYADAAISFEGIAIELGLSQFWKRGTKSRSVGRLIDAVLVYRPEAFCSLILLAVERSLSYRRSKGRPLARMEMSRINDLITKVGFKIPELWDPAFLDELHHEPVAAVVDAKSHDVGPLRAEFNKLHSMTPQTRGFEFEAFLAGLFATFEMAPRSSFRNSGEQIDGSFTLDGEIYLLEAKWENQTVGARALQAFSANVASKAEWARGLFVSYSGFSCDGLAAFVRGKPTNIICMDGLDLHSVIEDSLDLRSVIRSKARMAAETNEAFVRVRDLML